jgi:exonuclease SbcD
VPITADDGSVPLVVVAVPYVHAWRLAVDDQSNPETLENAFRALYGELADAAASRWPEAILAATGHLTCARERSLVPGHSTDADRVGMLDSPQEIHMVGTLGALPPTVFDERFRYVALGHIHRGYPVDGGRVWYSGTPVAVNFGEGVASRKVLLVDIEGDALPVVRPLSVPATRGIVEVRGDEGAIRAAFLAVPTDGDLPTAVSVIAEGTMPVLGQREALRDLLESRFPDPARRPVIASWRDLRTAANEGSPEPPPTPAERPSPETVFRLAWTARHGSPPDAETMAGFSSLLSDELPGRGD